MSRPSAGFTLLELLVALVLGALVLALMLQLIGTLGRGLQVQQSLGLIQSQARYAEQQLAARSASAGYHPMPWLGTRPNPVQGSNEGAEGSRLTLREWSAKNCLGNDNPVQDATGEPEFFVRASDWRLAPGKRLVETCYYGPPGSPGTRQLNASTRVEHVEAFRVQFAEDLDGDKQPDRWVRPGLWADENRLLGLRFALLIASPLSTGATHPGSLQLLGETIQVPDDGKLRLAMTRTVAFEGRKP